MSTPAYQLMWGPGLIGLTIAGALYGVGVGQFIFYVRAFPLDKVHLKLLVFTVFVLDSVQTLMSYWYYRYLLVNCRSNNSPECAIYLPTPFMLVMFPIYCITLIVQCFYAHRVWIISGRNRVITTAVFVFALAQLVLGLACTAELTRTPTYEVLFTTKFPSLAAAASAVCDALITGSIMYYLRPARAGVNRHDNYITKLNIIFVKMGLLSFLNAVAVVVAYYLQDDDGVGQFLTAGPGMVLSKTYLNSMFSVLNARKPIRDEQAARAQRTIELPTIPTIHYSATSVPAS